MSFPRAGACFGVRCLCLPGRFAAKSSVLNREEFQCRTPTRARRLEAARLELRWAGLVPTGGFAPIPKGGEVAARALSAENGLHAGVQSAGR